MKARFLAPALALTLLAPGPAARADDAPPAPGMPNFVQLVSLTGLPADSLLRERFMAGFRGQFADDELPAEHMAGEWEPTGPVFNRFRWLEGDPADNAWTLQVVIGSPPAVVLPRRSGERGHRVLESHRRSRGMIASLVVQGPDRGAGRPAAVQQREAFVFPGPASDSDPAPAVPGVGYLFPWNEAGRVVAKLALDLLHHQHGDMTAAERLVIAPAVRAEAGR